MRGGETRQHLLVIENLLGVAHRRIWSAAMEAENLADQGLADDLHELHQEIRRIHDASISGRLRRSKPLT